MTSPLYNASDGLVHFKFTVHSSFNTIIRDLKAPLTKLIRSPEVQSLSDKNFKSSQE